MLRSRSKSGPLRRSPLRIFDNQVEHASREKSKKFGLIILTIFKLRSLSSAAKSMNPFDLRR